MLVTGYFGRPSMPGQSGIATQVHLVKSGGKGLCGYKPHPTMKFQWCSPFPNWGYVECPSCRKKYRTQILKELKN